MKPLPRLLSYFRRYRARALLALLAMAVVAAATVALLFLLQQVIDDVLGAGASRSLPGVSAPLRPLRKTAPLLRWLEAGYAAGVRAAASAGIEPRYAIPLLLLAALLVKNVFAYLSEFALNSIGLAMVRDLRRDAYASLLGQSTRFSSERSSGDLMTRLLADAEQIQTAFGSRMADFVQGILTMLLVLVYVFSLNFRLALAVLVVAPLVVLPIAANFRRFRRQWLSARERIGEMGSILGETLRGHSLIKTYAMEEFEAERFDEANRRYFGAIRQSIRLQALNSPLMEILAGVGLSIIFIYAAGQIRAGLMTVGGLMSFLAAILMMYKPLKDVTRTNIVLQMALASADRIFEVVDAENEIVEKPGARDLAPFSGAIAYENVSFAYGQEPVLSDIDLTIRRGETVALVGPSGAGKTTLVGLLSRLYDPTAGRITLDGVDLRDAKLRLAPAPDRPRHAGDDPLRYDRPPEHRLRRDRAFRRSASAPPRRPPAPTSSSSGCRTATTPTVGEGASRLSGGQRQRLAIARAIYKDAPILILDEATSQLDTESEALIARALANLMRGRTTLVIAHRLSTVRRADRILVLDGGRIVEQGSHAELLTRRGVYRRLHDMQYFAESETSPSTASAPPHLVP